MISLLALLFFSAPDGLALSQAGQEKQEDKPITITIRPRAARIGGAVRVEIRIARHKENVGYYALWGGPQGEIGARARELDGEYASVSQEPFIVDQLYYPGTYEVVVALKRFKGYDRQEKPVFQEIVQRANFPVAE